MKKALFLIVLCLFLPSIVFAETTGTIAGVILDGKTGDALIEAGVEVVDTGKKVFTDIDGKYNLALPPGKYEIRVFYPQYRGQRVKDITVNPGKSTRIDLALEPKTEEIQVVEVVVEAAKATEATQLLIRKKASAVTDSVSAETISKQPDSDVAAVVERAPGITVVDDKFVYIRGLGERYTSATLNDTSLASTQTEKKVVPLDLFSADIVESINVVKSYTPDLSGEFTAGVVQITTKDYPDAFEMKFSASTEYNSETTGKDFKTYKGGDWDWLAFDDGTRELPDGIPGKKVVGGSFTEEELERFGENFSNIWNAKTKTALPSSGGNFHIGNKYDKFGIVFDLTYDADYQIRHEKLFNYYPPEDGLFGIQKNQDFTYWEEKYTWSGILNMGYELSPTDKLSFKNLYTRKAKDEVRLSEGFVDENKFGDDPDTNQINTKTSRLYWSEEAVYSGQLSGTHYFPGLPLLTPIKGLSSNIKWRLGYGHSTLDEPDMREIIYTASRNSPHDFMFYDSGKSGSRSYTELEEDSYEWGFDWELDIAGLIGHPIKVKFGPTVSYRDRTFDYRTFQFAGSFIGIDRTEDPESIFNPENIGPGGIQLQENTQPSDHYEADHRIIAGYLMADTPKFFHENLRFVGGLRIENSEQTLDGFDHEDRTPPFTPINVSNKDTDYFPSANLIYSLGKDMNLRFGYSHTVNRPEFREIAPSLFRDSATGIETVGNSDLQRALITSYDLRWEWFLSPEELLALSLFYKGIKDPIERTREIASSTVFRSTFQNSEKAQNYGFEVEIRKNLEFVHPYLSPFNVLANYAYVESEVEIKDEGVHTVNMTSKNRPLQGQSDHVANLILEYNPRKLDLTARLLYNYVGQRISDVGVLGLPDIMEEPTHTLDFILMKRMDKWGIKFALKNLLDEKVLFTQGGKTLQRYKEGISASFSVSYGL